MFPMSLFLLVAGAWLAWRVVSRLERAVVAHRSVGWCRLLALGCGIYAVPALFAGRWWAVPVAVLAADATRHAALPLPVPLPPRLRLPRRRRPSPTPTPSNVIPFARPDPATTTELDRTGHQHPGGGRAFHPRFGRPLRPVASQSQRQRLPLRWETRTDRRQQHDGRGT